MIKYRGKTSLTDEDMNRIAVPHQNGWVYGYYVDGYIVGNIIESTEDYIAHEWWCWIIPETLGQYTGLKDKNGQEIYTGDVLRYEDILWNDCSRSEIEERREDRIISLVTPYNSLATIIKVYKGEIFPDLIYNSGTNEHVVFGLEEDQEQLEIIGNVSDNPELVGGVE